MDATKLIRSYDDLKHAGHKAIMANTRIGNLSAVEKLKEAATVADLIGGAAGAYRRAQADQVLSGCLSYLGDNAAAANAACSSG